MDKQLEIKINGVFKKKDGSSLNLTEFTQLMGSFGLLFNGDIVCRDSNEKKKEKPKPIAQPLLFQKPDWALVRNAESEGLMVSMDGLVERVRTDLNKELSEHFRTIEPKYNGTFDENSSVDYESVLDYINEYLKEKGINKRVDLPLNNGSCIYLVPITENLEIKILVVDEYHGLGESETYVMIDKFKITNVSGKKDVDKLIEFVNKYLK